MTTIACCTSDGPFATRLSEVLNGNGLRTELFLNEFALMRTLRHRGGLGLLLIDIGMDPSIEASILSWLSSRTCDAVPVIMLSSHWNPQRTAAALNAGADDCVAKPFDSAELVARIKALLRRRAASRPAAQHIEFAGFRLDQREGTLLDKGSRIHLTPREFALAWLFFSHHGQRLAREAISLALWGSDKEMAGRAIEQHVYKLRKKIGLSAERGVVIRTTYGQGYQLDQCNTEPPAHFAPAMATHSGRWPSPLHGNLLPQAHGDHGITVF